MPTVELLETGCKGAASAVWVGVPVTGATTNQDADDAIEAYRDANYPEYTLLKIYPQNEPIEDLAGLEIITYMWTIALMDHVKKGAKRVALFVITGH